MIDGSTLNHYWRGAARVEVRGSFTLPPPGRLLEWDELATAWIEPQVDVGLPTPRPDETPLYLVFGGNPDVFVGAFGRNSLATIAGRPAAPSSTGSLARRGRRGHGDSQPGQTAGIGGVTTAWQREREQALAHDVLGPLRSR